MLTGDCRFPTEQRFQAEFTNPQKEGTRNREKKKKKVESSWVEGWGNNVIRTMA